MIYKGLIFTDHALDRMSERGVTHNEVWATWNNPDNSRYAKSRGAWVYFKTLHDKKIEVVAKKNERQEWLLISVWSSPSQKNRERLEKKFPTNILNLLKKVFGF